LKAYGDAGSSGRGFNPRDAQPPFANFKPPAAEEEIPASALQFVRNDGSGFGRNYGHSLT
jgi:hypothetical protein